MLPKIWKKLLLAICIIACLFNITVKLVNRISLEKVIQSQQEGVNVKEILNITDEKPVVTKTNNTVSNYNVIENEPVVNQDNEKVNDIETINTESNPEEVVEDTENVDNSENIENSENMENSGNDEQPSDASEESGDFMSRMFNSSGFSDLMGN